MTNFADLPALPKPNLHRLSQGFRHEGFFLLPEILTDATLAMLRHECFLGTTEIAAQIARGDNQYEINHYRKRYYVPFRSQQSDALCHFVFSDLMASICEATIGPNAYLFLDQFVVKPAAGGLPTSWHQDSGYVVAPHKPYLSCWCALDDMSEENGTLFVLPFTRHPTQNRQPHVQDVASRDLVGYFGQDPGDPLFIPAGTIVVFSSLLFHRSVVNLSNQDRRAFLVEFSPEPIMNAEGTAPLWLAKPFPARGTTP